MSCAHRTGCVQGRLILCVTPSTAPGSTSALCPVLLRPRHRAIGALCSPLHRALPRRYSLTTRVPVWNATLKAARQSADRNEKSCLMRWCVLTSIMPPKARDLAAAPVQTRALATAWPAPIGTLAIQIVSLAPHSRLVQGTRSEISAPRISDAEAHYAVAVSR